MKRGSTLSALSERDQVIAWAAAQRLLPAPDPDCPVPYQLAALLQELSKDDPGFTLRFACSLQVPVETVWPRFVVWMLETICLPKATRTKDKEYIAGIILLFRSGDWKDRKKAAAASAAYAAAASAAASAASRKDAYTKMRTYLTSLEPSHE